MEYIDTNDQQQMAQAYERWVEQIHVTATADPDAVIRNTEPDIFAAGWLAGRLSRDA